MALPSRSSIPAHCTNSSVAEKKAFLLRMDAEALDALQRWAADELRSLNGQIEFLLRHQLRKAGRLAQNRPPGGGTSKKRGLKGGGA